MAHSKVTVCVVVVGGQTARDAVEAALAPFDMALGTHGRWDRWTIDGGETAWALPVRAGCEDDPRILRLSAPPEQWPPDRCDGAPRGLLDFEVDRAAVRSRAEAEWAQWHEFASRYPAGRPVEQFLRRFRADPAAYPIDVARREHMQQPVIRALMAAEELDPQRFIWHEATDPIQVYGDDADDYVRRCVARVVPTDELLRTDRVWMDDGDFMSGELVDTAKWDLYYAAADAYLDALPDDVYVVRVRIHS